VFGLVSTAFDLLPSVRRPSSMPRLSTSRSGLSSTMLALSRATSTASSTEMPNVGGVQRGRVVDAVAEVAHGVTGTLQRAHGAVLLLRVDLDEEVGLRAAPRSTSRCCCRTWPRSPIRKTGGPPWNAHRYPSLSEPLHLNQDPRARGKRVSAFAVWARTRDLLITVQATAQSAR